MANVLVISGHPDLSHSLANRTILETLRACGLSFTLRRLDETPFRFDVEEEQELLKKADVIVLQFPMFWYSFPALMKYWLEQVFTHGFAYGSESTALKGKKFLISFTTGSPKEAFGEGAPNAHTLEEYTYSLKQIAAMCGMEYLEPIVTCAAAYILGVSPEGDQNRITAACKAHGEKLAAVLKAL